MISETQVMALDLAGIRVSAQARPARQGKVTAFSAVLLMRWGWATSRPTPIRVSLGWGFAPRRHRSYS